MRTNATVSARRLVTPIILLHMCCHASATLKAQPVITRNGDDTIASITGLDIGGTTYDVTVKYATFNDVFGVGPATPPLYWLNAPGALVAAESIRDELNNQTAYYPGVSANEILVPYGPNDGVTFFDFRSIGSDNNNPWGPDPPSDFLFFRAVAPGPEVGIATFALNNAAAVPEPSSFIVCCGLAAGGGLYRRRRSRKSPSSSTPPTA